MKKILSILALAFVFNCSSGNLEWVKEGAEVRWHKAGFEMISYTGYEWCTWGLFGSKYGGACVWYTLKKIGDVKNRIYKGHLYRWGNESHIYNLSPIAIVP